MRKRKPAVKEMTGTPGEDGEAEAGRTDARSTGARAPQGARRGAGQESRLSHLGVGEAGPESHAFRSISLQDRRFVLFIFMLTASLHHGRQCLVELHKCANKYLLT